MALFDDIAKLIARLAPRGWAQLFLQNGGGLDLNKPKAQLAAELRRPLTGINRPHPGFEELCAEATRAIEPGSLARSLLYHALASPDVHPLTSGEPANEDYATLEELDLLENYIFSLAPKKLSSFINPIIVVVACQYRTRAGAPHQQHADMAFSRTGVARVGTEAGQYRGAIRSYDPRPATGERGFAAQPARYAAYIAEYGAVTAAHAVHRSCPLDPRFTFTMPVHKLFSGSECLLTEDGSAMTLSALRFAELHLNEKLARMHRTAADNPGRIPPAPGFNLAAHPFVRTSKTNNDLIKLELAGASVLVNPVPNVLVRIAHQTVNGKSVPVHFPVPKQTNRNRFWSSLQLPFTGRGRAAPEYANIRLELTRNAAGQWEQRDLNMIPEPPPTGEMGFDEKLKKGEYLAAHFIDQTCDGVITIEPIAGLPLEILPAFSLVTAVDYFPQVEQTDVIAWLERIQNQPVGLSDPKAFFPQGGPQPLSDGRFVGGSPLVESAAMPNSQLIDPLDPEKKAFSPQEVANLTATAIVGWAAAGQSAGQRPDASGASSWLPDAASDFFAPGWDVSRHIVSDRPNYVGYGLGSPFPEDSKLCAALNSFWPAVAPDSSRTYGVDPLGNLLPTSIPMLDSEVGYHPQHPRVVAGEVVASLGWDGDEGPFFEMRNGQLFVNAVSPSRSDQSIAALQGRIGYSGLDSITTDDFIHRVEEFAFCQKRVLPSAGFPASALWLVTVELVPDWQQWRSDLLAPARTELRGAGFIFEFASINGAATAAGNPPIRVAYPVAERVQIQLSATMAFWRIDAGGWKKLTR